MGHYSLLGGEKAVRPPNCAGTVRENDAGRESKKGISDVLSLDWEEAGGFL